MAGIGCKIDIVTVFRLGNAKPVLLVLSFSRLLVHTKINTCYTVQVKGAICKYAMYNNARQNFTSCPIHLRQPM